MKLSNRHRFLFESALYLKRNPARAFRLFCAEVARIKETRANKQVRQADACQKTA